MATYYVRKTGSDAAAGTSAGAAWQTVGKALGASGIASGDTVYVGAGTYREVVSCALTSPTVETSVIADIDGSHTGDVGPVIWSAYTTDDVTTPSTSSLINLNQKDFLTFDGFWFVGGNLTNGQCVTSSASAGAAHSTNIKFKNCSFEGGLAGGSNANLVFLANGAQNASTWSFDRCIFFLIDCSAVWYSGVQSASGADWDEGISFTNCFSIGSAGPLCNVQISGSANTFKPGGFKISYCTHISNTGIFNVVANGHSTTVNSDIEHCFVVTGTSGVISVVTAGSAVREDYNRFLSGGAISANLTSGGHSDSYTDAGIVKHGLFDFGQSWLFGTQGRPFGTPHAGSNLLGAGAGGNIGAQAVDLLNRPRPAGGASANAAFGALERHDTAIAPGTTVGSDSGTGYIELVGVGDHDFDVPVDATATTFTIKTKTSGYSGTNYPQMKIVNGGECGVADASVDATSASASAYESISIGPFTPTAKGIVTVRLTNRSANGTGIAAFDTFSVS